MNISTKWTSSNSSAGSSGLPTYICDDGYCIFLAACVLNVLLSFPVNSYMIWLATGTGNGLAAEFFSLHLSVSEILLSLDCILFFFSFCSLALLSASELLVELVMISRSVFQMCVERFLAVVHPVTFLKLKPLRYRIFCAALVWIVRLGEFVISALDKVFSLFNVLLYFTLPQFFGFLFVQFFCLVSVLRALRQSGPGERKEENHRRRRAFHIICVISLSTVVTYVPFGISFYLNLGDFQGSNVASFSCNLFFFRCWFASFSLEGLILLRIKPRICFRSTNLLRHGDREQETF